MIKFYVFEIKIKIKIKSIYLQKPGPKPVALAFKNRRPGQKPTQAKYKGLAFFGPAWPGFWPQAGAGTSLDADYGGCKDTQIHLRIRLHDVRGSG